jgi:hypothetical protein
MARRDPPKASWSRWPRVDGTSVSCACCCSSVIIDAPGIAQAGRSPSGAVRVALRVRLCAGGQMVTVPGHSARRATCRRVVCHCIPCSSGGHTRTRCRPGRLAPSDADVRGETTRRSPFAARVGLRRVRRLRLRSASCSRRWLNYHGDAWCSLALLVLPGGNISLGEHRSGIMDGLHPTTGPRGT